LLCDKDRHANICGVCNPHIHYDFVSGVEMMAIIKCDIPSPPHPRWYCNALLHALQT